MLKTGDVIRIAGRDWEVKHTNLLGVSLKQGNYFTMRTWAEVATAALVERTKTGTSIQPRGDLFAKIYG